MGPWRRRLVTCVLATGFAAAAWAQPAAPPAANQQEIDQLIGQLSSPDEATRTKAQEKLVAMGNQALAALDAFIRTKSAAEATLARIEMNKIAKPTLVSIKMDDVTPEAALNELARQTAYTIQPYAGTTWGQVNASTISVAIDRQPFWAALREICGRSGLNIQAHYGSAPGAAGERKIVLAPAAAGGANIMKCPSSVHGAFMVVLSSITRNCVMNLTSPRPDNNTVNLSLMVWVEPKVKIVQYSSYASVEEAVDDKGNPLVPRMGYPDRPMNAAHAGAFEMNTALPYPASNPGQRIARLRGSVRSMAQTSSEVMEVAGILKAKSAARTVAGRKITVKEVRRINDRQYEVALLISRDATSAPENDVLTQRPDIKLVDEQGNREYAWSGRAGVGGPVAPLGRESDEVRWLFACPGTVTGAPVAGEPTKLVWEVPTGTQEMVIPFEFKDLPLP